MLYKIRLPDDQFSGLLVSPKTSIQEVLTQICNEKGFDKENFDVCHPGKV